MSNKDQQLVNQIHIRYGVDVTMMSDEQLEELISALEQVKDIDRENLMSPDDADAYDLDEEDLAPLDYEEL